LKKYELRKGYCVSQKRIITCEFIDGKIVTRIRHIQNFQGKWILKGSTMLGFNEYE